MPLKKCQRDGKDGWKWGDEGHCYIGEGAKEKALTQGRAIEASKTKEQFTSVYESLEDLLPMWNNLSDTQRIILTKLISGE